MVVTTFWLPRPRAQGGGGHESRRQAKQTETVLRPFNAKFVRAEGSRRRGIGWRRDGKAARATLTAAAADS